MKSLQLPIASLCIFLSLSAASPVVQTETENDVHQLFTKIVQLLPDVERKGMPDFAIEPIDPIPFLDLFPFFISIGVAETDYQIFTFPGYSYLTGTSGFVPSNITVVQDLFNYTYVEFISETTGPANFTATFTLNGIYNGTDMDECTGSLLLSVDGSRRLQEYSYTLANGLYSQYYEPVTEIELINPQISLTGLPDFLQELVKDRNADYASGMYQYIFPHFVNAENFLMIIMANYANITLAN